MTGDATHLYRHFDAKGRLLYIGIAAHVTARTVQHSHNAHWAADIARIDVQTYPTRKDAMDAEAAAIKRESPAYNVVHAIRATPPKPSRFDDARQELVRAVVFNPTYAVADLAKALSVSPDAVRRLHASGDLAHITIGERRYSTGWQLIDYMEALERRAKRGAA